MYPFGLTVDVPSSRTCLAHLKERHSVTITWTSHGKVPVDGIGDYIKRYVLGKANNRQNMVGDVASFSNDAEGMERVVAVHVT